MAITKPDIAALVNQMPDTDKQIEAKQKPEPEKPGEPRPNRRPDNFGDASKFTGPSPESAEKIFDEIIAGDRESILELIDLVRDPSDSDFGDYKAGYLLHGLAIYVGRDGKESQRRLFAEAIASQLANDKRSKALRRFLIRELQAAGGKEVVEILGRYLLDEDLGEPATQALIALREGAAAQFRKALGGAKDENRAALIQALGVVRDGESVVALKKALAETNSEVRVAAAWALANIGDASSVEAIIKLADAAESWERIQQTKACLLLAEKLPPGKKAEAVRIYTHLRDTRTEPSEGYIRGLAEKALGAAH